MKNCCSYWFEGWWKHCCCKHDKDYFKSGKSRMMSDKNLFNCVMTTLKNNRLAKIVNFPIATIMFIGVRVGGRKRYVRKQNITVANNKNKTYFK